jgi:hypothetical protein
VNGGELSFSERDQLARAFLAIEGMRDRQKRDMYIDELHREMGVTITFARHDEDRHDVHGLVAACLNYPNAVHVLAGILRVFYGGTTMMENLDHLVRQLLPDPLLQTPELRQLDQLLSDVDHESLAATYRASFGPLGPVVSLDGRDRMAVLRVLEEIGSSAGEPPPLLLFLERLTHVLSDDAAFALRRWIDDTAHRLGVAPAQIHALRLERPDQVTSDEDRSYFVVQIEEDPVTPHQYRLAVWLQDGRGRDEVLQLDDEPCPLPDIPGQIDRLLGEIAARIATRVGDPTIEVILPRTLLGHPVDRWPIRVGPGETPYPIGIEYPVVVRSLERMGNQMLRHRWQRKWRRLQSHGHAVTDRSVHWVVEPGASKPEQLLGELLYDETDDPICLVIAAAPVDGGHAGHEVDAGLHAGIPVLVWCRENRPIERLRADVISLLGHGVLGLPATVLRLRRDAVRLGEPPDHLGLRVSLIWDDPDRLPRRPTALKAPV